MNIEIKRVRIWSIGVDRVWFKTNSIWALMFRLCDQTQAMWGQCFPSQTLKLRFEIHCELYNIHSFDYLFVHLLWVGYSLWRGKARCDLYCVCTVLYRPGCSRLLLQTGGGGWHTPVIHHLNVTKNWQN